MIRLWHWLKSLFRRPIAPVTHPYNPDCDDDVQWLREQTRISRRATHRLRTLENDLYPPNDHNQRRSNS